MATSNIETYERSVQDGKPIECYKFTYGDLTFMYTSAAEDVSLVFSDDDGKKRTEKYFAEYIERDTIKPGAASTSPTDTVITVSKDNLVAKLWQGPPPEETIDLVLYRTHVMDTSLLDVVLTARICQASFKGSKCQLIAKQENWLAKEAPNGMYQYYCNSAVFDGNCRLKREDWQVEVLIDEVKGIDVYSRVFEGYPDGYFEGGRIYYKGYVRTIIGHKENKVQLKYPFVATPRNIVTVLPGCDHLFKTCAERYQNTKNFSGCPYVPPTDPEKNPTGQGAYWIDSQVIQRDTDGYVGSISL